MAKFVEEKKERSIIFIHEGTGYPSIKRAYLTDSEWRRMIFAKFDANERDYYHVNDCAILVFVKKGN